MQNEMSCVIYDHSRYTLDSARTASLAQVALYDKYDITNNTAAIAFLLDSLSPALGEIISEKLEETDSFHVVWLELMNEIQVQTIEWIEAIKKQVKDCRPQQYPGQDLEKLAVDFRAGALELHNAGQYKHNLTLAMLKSYLLAGGTDNEDYRFGLRMLKTKLDDELLAIGYMDKAQVDAHMSTHKLHYKDINSAATKAYRKHFDRGEWPPAKNLPDSKIPPAGYGANVAKTNQGWCGTQAEVLAMIQEATNGSADKVAWKGTQAEVLALIKQEGGGTKSGVCHNCNKPGHWSRECPKPGKDCGHNGTPNWKKVAPPANTPTTKTVNGKVFNWCSQCGSWTTTHDTSTHTGGTTPAKPEANLGLVESTTAWDVCDPSAWHVNLDNPTYLCDVWERFGASIRLLLFGMLFHFSPVFFEFLVCVLYATGMFLWEQGTHVLAPLCWFIGLIVTLWLGLLPFPPDPPEPWWQRRARQQSAQRQHNTWCGWDPGSICSHGLHKSYPIPLRLSGHHVTHPPKLAHQHASQNLACIMGELQHYLYLLGMARPGRPGTGRKGDSRQQKGCKKGCNGKGCGKKSGGNPLY
jgi:hypothetical protein